MARISQVPIGAADLERFSTVLSPDRYLDFLETAERGRRVLEGRVVWNVNSTARGGGVAEMLRPLLSYARAGGIDARWVVISGDPDFFAVTKRLHNHLHGSPGDGGGFGDAERQAYEATTGANAAELARLVSPGDVVIVHDPQPAGACSVLKEAGAHVVWRCHIGLDDPNEVVRGAWDFLRPYVEVADYYVFSRMAYAWEGLDEDRIAVIRPSIDAFSPKNQELDKATVAAILSAAGLLEENADGSAPVFSRDDGTPGRVDRRADTVEEAPVPPGAPIVLQVSRWDRLKDPIGVIEGFAEHVPPETEAHLIYAGPSVEAVADDPEGAEVLAESRRAWESLPAAARSRIHLTCLPMTDSEENAAIVNALQRRADIVVQKSIAEGFGLTVSEGMWKGRPVVASRIGGIQDQIEHGHCGLLVDDPRDLAAYGAAVTELLRDPDRAHEMGRAARERVREDFLGARHLTDYLAVIEGLLGG